ncbi:MAG TPA: hypothetical protein VFC54_14550 [Pseudolabrys sp.]|nr:hypothetical protein [Pseudolabrys sp.]
MDTIKTYVIPAFVLLALLLLWDFGKPTYFHGIAIPRYGAQPLEPSDLMPTFHAVPSKLARGSKDMPQEAMGDGVPPNNANENIFQKSRDSTRTSTMKSLEKAWSTFCTDTGRRQLAQALNHYFEQSGNQIESYSKRWGKEGHDYIAAQWSTTDDHRIERLVSETYERGYLDLSSVSRTTAGRMAPLLQGVRVQGQPCKD